MVNQDSLLINSRFTIITRGSMANSQMSVFDVVLLVVGIGASILGFQLINQVYISENGRLSWLMIIAIFNWLTLLIMFILLSLIVDMSKKELSEVRTMIRILSEKQKRK